MKKNFLFLLSHQPNPRFVKQIKFLSEHNDVSVVYYCRNSIVDLSNEYIACTIFNYDLGTISNGNYFQRTVYYLKSLKQLANILRRKRYDVLIVNNIDTLFLFKSVTLFQRNNTKIVIEISDLRAHTYLNSLKSIMIRRFEKFMFRFIDKLIITSPKFYKIYYSKLFKNEPFVLENKPLRNMIPIKLEKQNNKKVVIGIVGLLLQGKPYRTLFETIKEDNRYEVHIYGKGTYQSLVEEYAAKYDNIKYFGEYNFFNDSAEIYASLDILYMPYDTTNGSLNNKIALPNKLYEAMYFQVPIITSIDTYLGFLVEKYNIGINVKCCVEDELYMAVLNIRKKRKLFANNFEKLSKEIYIGDNDYKKLEVYVLNGSK